MGDYYEGMARENYITFWDWTPFIVKSYPSKNEFPQILSEFFGLHTRANNTIFGIILTKSLISARANH